jgi:6-phosphogluconolactonase
MNGELLIFPNIEELNRFAAEKFIETGNRAINERGQFTVALAGGSTPKALYKLLSGDNFRNKIDWKRVFFFFGDERNVPSDAEESNFRMANENLLKPLQIAGENVFRWQTELENASEIARNYESAIRYFFDSEDKRFPQFDLILLGMGDDGHTASLFPFTEALDETEKIAAANPVEKLETTRLTFTFPVINNARNIIFLIAGAGKAETLKEVLEGNFQPLKLPSQAVKPARGNLFWLVDAPAAEFLTAANR